MDNKDWDVFIFAGESSADLHGARVLESLYKINPEAKVFGVGGPKMREQGMDCIKVMEDFQVMGFIDVIAVLPKLMRLFYFIAKRILQVQPKVVLLIDYPGFNLKLASYLRKKKYNGKICQYVSPTVWAWKKKRIDTMVENLDILFSILPFEADFFSQVPLRVVYVGHPLVQKIDEEDKEAVIPELKNKRCISLFPGSREKEIIRNFPIQLRVAKRLLHDYSDLIFAISVSHERFFDLLENTVVEEVPLIYQKFTYVFPEKTYALMRSSTFAIAKSGTVTLELALHGVYTIVTYALTFLDYWIGKYIFGIKLKFYCIVNIICGKEVFPEFIGPSCREDNLYRAAKAYLKDKTKEDQFAADYELLKGILEYKKAGLEVALQIQQFLE
jgi:lipid-A-disaccharide synthase